MQAEEVRGLGSLYLHTPYEWRVVACYRIRRYVLSLSSCIHSMQCSDAV
jgi:hypothetical protein